MDRAGELKARLAAKKAGSVAPVKKAGAGVAPRPVKRVGGRKADAPDPMRGVVEDVESAGPASKPKKKQGSIVPGTNHGTILCKCRNGDCVEHGERKMIRIPMIGKVLFLPGTVLCGECLHHMEWDARDVHVDRIGSGVDE